MCHVIRSHYVTMVDNNRGRFFLAVEPAYADVEYVFFISSRWYHMLLLSCCLHNCRPGQQAVTDTVSRQDKEKKRKIPNYFVKQLAPDVTC
jgi:hypothetical protein